MISLNSIQKLPSASNNITAHQRQFSYKVVNKNSLAYQEKRRDMADASKAYSYTNAKGQTYYLHTKEVTLKNGRVQRIYYFARDVRDGALASVPAGYEVMETKRTNMPVLKRSK